MLLLGLDFETTGLDVNKDLIIEIGAVIWDSERQVPVDIFSCFVNWGVDITENITEITHITKQDVSNYGMKPALAFDRLNSMIASVEAIIGHNVIGYDIEILKSNLKKLDIQIISKPTIDTMIDIPCTLKSKTLSSMLFANEILNYFPHRAFSDALCTLKLLQKFDIDVAYNRSKYAVIKVIAIVSFDQKDLAKNAGFHWDATLKEWSIEMRECDYDLSKYNFRTKSTYKGSDE